MQNIIFGPINSRRFGISIGIDLSPSIKQCNFDCLYCELKQNKVVSEFKDIIKVEDILKELKIALVKNSDIKIDFITITANGEPTLYPFLDLLVDKINLIKEDIKTLILSNGSTIFNKNIQKTVSKIDVVKLSLDCVTDRCLKKLDRAKDVNVKDIMRGMLEFKKISKKSELVIEILFVKNMNDGKEEIEKLNSFLLTLKPDRIDLNSIDRPPAYSVQGLTYYELLNISYLFDKTLQILITSRKKVKEKIEEIKYSRDEILFNLSRRPLTEDDIDSFFDKETKNRISELLKDKLIRIVNINNFKFLTIA